MTNATATASRDVLEQARRVLEGTVEYATPAPSPCCSSERQAVCCEPSEKASCCGTDAQPGGSCGCQ